MPPALGHFQFDVVAVFNVEWPPAYHRAIVPLFDLTPSGLFLAFDPIASSSATVGEFLVDDRVERAVAGVEDVEGVLTWAAGL